jgi:peptide deformylase
MKLPILTYPDPVLARKARPVEALTPEIRALINDMIETMYEGDGVGLAAPQVGRSIRLVVLDQTGPKRREELIVLANPEIVACDGEMDSEESCLSVPGFKVPLRRKQTVRVRGQDREGRPIELAASDYLAVIIQHELDHLDGVLILDRAGRLKRGLYEKKVKKWQERKEPA